VEVELFRMMMGTKKGAEKYKKREKLVENMKYHFSIVPTTVKCP
jgi:hypothetical protein